ncbi:hypothetical protein QUF75_19560 [Desulfococcaceae bacterium HSG7]|nr:hypothetical protein [Desulfococcaceae bacterium HSG7]
MIAKAVDIYEAKERLSVEKIKVKIRSECENNIEFCTPEHEKITFLEFEKELWKLLSHMGRLYIQPFLISCHNRSDYSKWLNTGLYYMRKALIAGTIKTVFGEVRYFRTYQVGKNRIAGSFYPIDIVSGLTRDGFSPSVISQATRLAARVSFITSVKLFTCFYGWSPSIQSFETSVSGSGREAGGYMEAAEAPEGDSDVLIIEADGKATPTATDEESESVEKEEVRIKRDVVSGIEEKTKGREKSGKDERRVTEVRTVAVLLLQSCIHSEEELTVCSMDL